MEDIQKLKLHDELKESESQILNGSNGAKRLPPSGSGSGSGDDSGSGGGSGNTINGAGTWIPLPVEIGADGFSWTVSADAEWQATANTRLETDGNDYFEELDPNSIVLSVSALTVIFNGQTKTVGKKQYSSYNQRAFLNAASVTPDNISGDLITFKVSINNIALRGTIETLDSKGEPILNKQDNSKGFTCTATAVITLVYFRGNNKFALTTDGALQISINP